MKCPHRIIKKEQTKWEYTYNEEGKDDMIIRDVVTIQEFSDCFGENCASWQDGKCCYNIKQVKR